MQLNIAYNFLGAKDSGGSVSKSKGLEDPSLTGIYRFLNEEENQFKAILDFKLGLSPKIGNAKEGSGSSDGNLLSGGSQYFFVVS